MEGENMLYNNIFFSKNYLNFFNDRSILALSVYKP